jgi:hypothetical protein
LETRSFRRPKLLVSKQPQYNPENVFVLFVANGFLNGQRIFSRRFPAAGFLALDRVKNPAAVRLLTNFRVNIDANALVCDALAL